MKTNKTIGWLLIFLALLVILGFFVKNGIYWEMIDIIVVVVVCGAGGIALLRKGDWRVKP